MSKDEPQNNQNEILNTFPEIVQNIVIEALQKRGHITADDVVQIVQDKIK